MSSNSDHYRTGSIEAIDVIEDWDLDFNLGNVVKYISRAGHKDGNTREQDLYKALNYLHRAATGKWLGSKEAE